LASSIPTLIPRPVSQPDPGNDDAVKSIRIIVETVVAAIQSGLAQRASSAALERGGGDQQAAAAAAGAEQVDLSRVEIPAEAAAAVEGEAEAAAPKKKPATRAKRPVVKAE
jgi:small subunit ribosomal protein S2